MKAVNIYIFTLVKPHIKLQGSCENVLRFVENPNYSEFSLINVLDLSVLCIENGKFPDFLEKLYWVS